MSDEVGPQLGVPEYLDRPASGSPPAPPVTTAAQVLPFEQLLWEDFERLCVRLARLEGEVVEHVSLYGTRGQNQDGIDLYARLVDGSSYATYQCKRYSTFDSADIDAAVDRFLDGAWATRSSRFVLCVSTSAVRTQLAETVETAAARLRSSDPSVSFELWDAEGLSLKLKDHPKLVLDFFGRPWQERFAAAPTFPPPTRPERPQSSFQIDAEVSGRSLSADDLQAQGDRLLVLLGEAGVGKSHLLTEFAAQAPPTTIVVYVELALLGDKQVRDFAKKTKEADLLELLLKGSDAVTRERFEHYVANERTQLIVDGLNELLDPSSATAIVELLEELSHKSPNLTVVAASRTETSGSTKLRRPRMFGPKWIAGYVRRLPSERVKEAIDQHYGSGTWDGLSTKAQQVLQVPFFLRRAIEGIDPSAGSRAAALSAFFEEQIKLPDAALERIGWQVLKSYKIRLRQVELEKAQKATITRLADAGVWVRIDKRRALFTHQLYGDYLVSRCLAGDPELWASPYFNAVTFGVQARDPVLLAAEQLAQTEAIDEFVRAVYNWHWVSAVGCLLAAEAIDGHQVSPALDTMVVALLSERRSDPIGGTGARATRLLPQFTGSLAAKLEALAPDATRAAIIGRTYDDARYLRWHNVFCRDNNAPWSESEIAGIADVDSLHGWTVSNVLRRTEIDERVARDLRAMYRAADGEATRWRIVHALGRDATSETLSLLLEALARDDEFWVRFGAVRSVVEIAARTADPSLRSQALSRLGLVLGKLPDTIADMAAWTAMYEGSGPEFQQQAHDLFLNVQSMQATEAARDRWGQRISDLVAYWEGRLDEAFFGADPYYRED